MGYAKQLSISALALLCVTACSMHTPRADAQHSNDARIADDVRSALRSDPVLVSRHLEVSVQGGVVHLHGVVGSNDELTKARKDAEAVAGVTKVDTEIELQQRGTGGEGPG